jgi:UDP-N-acetyl-2-amino-2-deoxyglucuronate dehydrogenase
LQENGLSREQWLTPEVGASHVAVVFEMITRARHHLEKARVRWFLSINYNTLPNEYKNRGLRTYRSLSFDGEEIEFSKGFENLHSASYAKILNGQGYRISEAKRAVETAYKIRHQEPIGLRGDYHPFANMELDKHPFKRNYN